MKKLYTLLLLIGAILSGNVAQATHIVGGEFEMLRISGTTYQITMNMYFDAINGNPAAIDPDAVIYIYRKVSPTGPGVLVESLTLFKLPLEETVAYTNPECAVNSTSLQTRIIKYRANITLNPSQYSSQGGYYMIWQRCCRNGTISNIQDPGGTGQVFYLEFPPIRKNNVAFINSSPRLFPPLSDFACVNEDFEFDFSGADVDGDSLVYAMRTPLKGNSSTIIPLPSTGNVGPYDSVVWLGGYSGNNAVNGTIPLQINRKTGILRLRAAQTGLYVFAVLCQEYRNGVYIGQVRRDFQLLVKDCQPNDPPVLGIKNPNTNAPYLTGDTIRIRATDTNRCIRFRVQDKPLVTGQVEKLKIKAEALNFDATLFPFTMVVSGTTTNATNDSITATICFDQCTHSNRIDSLFKIRITATDNGCSLPKSDRDTLAFWVEPPFNNAPTLAGRATNLSLRTDTVRLVTGQSFFYPVQGKDTEADFLYFKTIAQTPLPANVQVELPQIFRNFKGVINTGLTFRSSCDAPTATPYIFDFILSDSSCVSVKYDTLRLVVKVSAAPNDAPIISVNDVETSLDSFQIVAGTSQTIVLKGRDINNNKINFSVLESSEFLTKNGISFVPASAVGSVETNIVWTPPCLYQGDLNFTLTFVLTDDGCPIVAADTVKIKFKVIYLPNETPTIELPASEPRTYTVIPSEVINISQLLGRDANIGDILSMNGWIDDTLALSRVGATLSTETSTAQVRGSFNWPITCSLVREKPYKVSFVVSDNGCPQMNSDTLDLFVTVIDSADRDFVKYNVTTPNDNLKNDVFRLPNLPPDNCRNQFVSIEIYNRWGKKVFYDNKRNFAWNAKNMSSGTYFYAVRYTNKVYRGWVDVLP